MCIQFLDRDNDRPMSSRVRLRVSGNNFMPKKPEQTQIAVNSQNTAAIEPIKRWDSPVNMGKSVAHAKMTSQRKVVVTPTALARTRVGKISDIINQGNGPRAMP